MGVYATVLTRAAGYLSRYGRAELVSISDFSGILIVEQVPRN